MAVSLIIGALAFGYHKGVVVAEARYESERAKQVAQILDLERHLQQVKNEREVKDAENQKKISVLSDRIRVAGRLRDPNATACPGTKNTGSSDSSATNRAETGGLLSMQLTDLLARVLRESDEINNAYASCRADAYTIRGK